MNVYLEREAMTTAIPSTVLPARDSLPRRMKDAVKRTLWPLKKTLRRMLGRPATARALVADLRAFGVRPGGLLLVHSSLSAFGYVIGGAPTIIRALITAVGPKGTLVIPTHSWAEMMAGGRTFDARHTGVCVGAVPETFRHWPGAVRSLHPTHSVAALGPAAVELTAGHERASTPCGSGTPYCRILDQDGQVLFLGVDLEANTAFHTMEALAEMPGLLNDHADDFTIIDAEGREQRVRLTRHRAAIPRRFREVEAMLTERGLVRVGRVGRAKALLLSGLAFRDALSAAMRDDPSFLVARKPNEETPVASAHAD